MDRRPLVFISHAHQDRPHALRLQQALEAAGHPCFIDQRDIPGGSDWLGEIEAAIGCCYAFVSLVSEAANRSRYVKTEFLEAEHRGKPLFPLLLAGAALPWYMLTQQAIDLAADFAAGLGRLLRDLPAPGSAVPPAATARDAELAYLGRVRLAEALQQPDLYTPLAGAARRARVRMEVARLFMRPEMKLLRAPGGVVEEGPAEPLEDVVAAFPALHRAVLLGEPGAGKSTSLWKLAREAVARAEADPAAPLPLFAPLGQWTDPEQPLERFLAALLDGLDPADLLRSDRLLLLLDGLNELPTDQHAAKGAQLRKLVQAHPRLPLLASCREADYREALALPVSRIVIAPLSPGRVREFLGRYLAVLHPQGAEVAAEGLFWQIAGGEAVRDCWQAWARAGAGLELFWAAEDIPRQNPNVHRMTTTAQDAVWWQVVRAPHNPMRLAGNPYLLAMLLAVYEREGGLPANRGQLFAEFVRVLLAREGLADEAGQPGAEGARLLAALARLAWRLQERSGAAAVQVSLPEADAAALLGRELLEAAVRCSLLEWGGQVRFRHQLLQEYFTALGMKAGLEAGELEAGRLFPQPCERSGWEEAVVLLAGLFPEDCSPVLHWLGDAAPTTSVACALRSGARVAGSTLDGLAARWLQHIGDIACFPDPRVRAAFADAVGRLGRDRRRGGGGCGRTGCRISTGWRCRRASSSIRMGRGGLWSGSTWRAIR